MSAEIINLKDALAKMVGVPSPASRAAQRAEWLLLIYGDRRVVRRILLPDELNHLANRSA